MKILRFAISFIFLVCMASADDLPRYKMVELGVFETDESVALSVNETGQVAGTCKEGDNNYIFFWDNSRGLTLMEFPLNGWINILKLNNQGQITGLIDSESYRLLFFWDSHLGFWEMEHSKDDLYLVGFNDKSQVLGQSNNQIFLWDHGKKISLSTLFTEQVQGSWNSLRAVSLNNHGHVIFSAHKPESKDSNNWGTRSFVWNGDSFEMVLPERNWDTSITPICLDDSGNMIVNLYPRRGGVHSQYYINPSKYVIASCQGCHHIRDGVPVAIECLPGKQKMDNKGRSYFTKGIEIKKLFKDEYPYYNVAKTVSILDQNSRGYVVGSIGTMYPGSSHAFLAIPEKGK